MDLQMPRTAIANEEVVVKMTVKTELRECMVVSRGLEERTLEKHSSLIMNTVRIDYSLTLILHSIINNLINTNPRTPNFHISNAT